MFPTRKKNDARKTHIISSTVFPRVQFEYPRYLELKLSLTHAPRSCRHHHPDGVKIWKRHVVSTDSNTRTPMRFPVPNTRSLFVSSSSLLLLLDRPRHAGVPEMPLFLPWPVPKWLDPVNYSFLGTKTNWTATWEAHGSFHLSEDSY